MTYYNDADLIDKFRLSKDAVLNILNDVDDDLNNGIQRNSSDSPLNQLFVIIQLEIFYQKMAIYLECTNSRYQ